MVVIRRSQDRPSSSSCWAGRWGYSLHSLSTVMRRPSIVAEFTDDARSLVRTSRVSMPVPAISSASASRLPGTGQIAAVTVPKVLAISGW